MASRAILRRKSFISDYVHASTCSIQTFQYIGHAAAQTLDSNSYNQPESSLDFNNIKVVARAELVGFSGAGLFSTRRFCSMSTAVLGVGNVRSEFVYPMRLMTVSIRNASTAATAKQPDFSDDEEDGEIVSKRRKEALPEECDQAVEGLSTAKAKVKAKRLHDSQKVAESVLRRTWAMLLGVGPALRAVASMSRADWTKKLGHWKHEIVSTLKHYWLGFKLLWVDVRISSRLLLKLAGGRSLSRRERQQLTRTTADIFRLVPFAVFIIVPFMEFLLPVFLKLFPNMLPSTFQDKMKEEEALKRRLNARIEYAKFLQDTVKEMAKEVQHSRSGEIKKTAEDLDEFLTKVRRGAGVSNEEILGFAKLFNDELTLDNISRSRLVSMCKYMGISPFGTDAYLRYMLRKRLQRIKNDDKLIQAEGVESLSEAELREDCRERGMLGLLSVEEMRQQVFESILLCIYSSSSLSGVKGWVVVGKISEFDVICVQNQGVLFILREVLNLSYPVNLIYPGKELQLEEEEKEEEELAWMKESSKEDVPLKEMTALTASEAQELARARTMEKQEHLCKLSRALAVLASASSVSREREEFLGLVNKEIELYNSMVEKEGTDGEKEAFRAYVAAREESDRASEVDERDEVSSALIERVDAMLQNLEKEIDDVDAKIGDHWRILDRDSDGKVTPEEVASAAMYLKDTLGEEGIQELISNLCKDGDGKILVEDIVKLGSRLEDSNTAE
ncbi:leucine zipper-ef-hand containing transmembrane protein, putative [Ricinus communis]|uniref:Mitochondrial proton/calcium exchanger protein n=1 Tax=Ricinus communis TaxID=3988 RepID=B9SV02_RICCO|nr:leucine zipper-ef-hand containing transmembrane protein, putative [Ricinus communis]